jgi:hypothetical protein
MLVVEGFQKFAAIPFGISRIFESPMPQQIGANRRKNRSIQVKDSQEIDHKMGQILRALRVLRGKMRIATFFVFLLTGRSFPLPTMKLLFLPPAARGAFFEKTAPLDPPQKRLLNFMVSG